MCFTKILLCICIKIGEKKKKSFEVKHIKRIRRHSPTTGWSIHTVYATTFHSIQFFAHLLNLLMQPHMVSFSIDSVPFRATMFVRSVLTEQRNNSFPAVLHEVTKNSHALREQKIRHLPSEKMSHRYSQ